MAFNKRTWKGRQGTGLNKFSINGATPVTVVNQPDSITEVGDALSAGNLNNLENRIAEAFDETASQEEVTNLSNTLQATNARVENLEQEHGSYQEVTVKSPYTVPSGKAKNWSVNVLRGVTRGKNNILANGDFSDGTSGWVAGIFAGSTVTASNNVLTIESTGICANAYHAISYVSGHKYLVVYDIRTDASLPTGAGFYTAEAIISSTSVPTASWHTEAVLITATSSDVRIGFYASGTSASIQIRNVFIVDLTFYFNGSIPSDAQTIADIQQNYPELLVPSEYGSSLVDTEYEGVKSVEVNIWDEVTESGDINALGQDIPNPNYIRSVGYTRCVPSTAYYIKSSKNVLVNWYDANKNYISVTNPTMAGAVTSPTNACYFRIVIYGSTYENATQVCLNSYADKTTYHPHMTTTLSLPTPVTLRSAGSVAEEFDLESGVKSNPIGSVDLSTLTWTYDSTSNWWYNTDIASQIATLPTANTIPSLIHDSLIPLSFNQINANTTTLGINTYYQNGNLLVRNGSSTTPPSGVLVFVRRTALEPTQLEPIQNPYLPTESGGTISSILTDAVDDSMTLGYINL